MLYFIRFHVVGFRGQLFGGFVGVKGLSGWPAGPVRAAVWKAEAETSHHLHKCHFEALWVLWLWFNGALKGFNEPNSISAGRR